MSTYDEWRFCWLTRQSTRISTVDEKRELAGTRIYKWKDDDLPKALVYYLDNMSRSVPQASIDAPRKGEYHLHMDRERVTWKEFKADYDRGGFPATGKTTFFTFALVGSGAQGTAWKGCDEEGNACIVKVFDKLPKIEHELLREAVQKELQVWHEVFNEKRAFTVDLTTTPALIMPILDQPKNWDDQHRQAVRTAVLLYSARYFAEDLKKEHIGFYSKDANLKAILFDTQPTVARMGGKEDMLKKLEL